MGIEQFSTNNQEEKDTKTSSERRESVLHRVDGGTLQERELIHSTKAQEFREKRNEGEENQLEKGETLNELIQEIDERLRNFLAKYGLENPIPIQPDQISMKDIRKFLKDENLTPENFDINGFYNAFDQEINVNTLDWKKEKYNFVHVLAHEMVHMQAFQSARIVPEDGNIVVQDEHGQKVRAQSRRSGLRVTKTAPFAKETDEELATYLCSFAVLDEAVTEELTKRFLEENESSVPIIRKEFAMKKYKKKMDKAFQVLGIRDRKKSSQDEGDGYLYYEPRQMLADLIYKIHKANPEKYPDEETVFRLFTQAALNGNMLPLGRAIEETLGKGSFREISVLNFPSRKYDW